ncbi:metal ABC transporter permease [Alkalibacter saccharofermentans]|uniref:Zinc transport system permease protein n=1 Tax=Alkalibacter saccharofermentans DSM 14828 TaxID=1120975 RepID=A0A1M4XWY7_9FIRM|nr:metal ABC transporter permease [Alkalibacter saccharofermentans]SHE97955.1 zinc transport system permease protein [Alkalibacter saccharofermentans DSM 14828]
MLEIILEYTFMRNAFYSAVLSSIICGMIGTVIVEKKLVSMSGGIAHTSFGGIGLGYFMGIEPLIGGLAFSLGAALGISAIKRSTNTESDTLIGMFWAVGMALGVIFIAINPGYPPDMTSYLFGDILTVSNMYVKVIAGLAGVIFLLILSLYRYWQSFLFDDEYLKILGVNTAVLEYLLYGFISLSIVILIKVVGIVLAIALLTIPPATAKIFAKNLGQIMIYSTLIGCGTSIGGMWISYLYNIPSGATIIMLSILVYGLMYPVKTIAFKAKDVK